MNALGLEIENKTEKALGKLIPALPIKLLGVETIQTINDRVNAIAGV